MVTLISLKQQKVNEAKQREDKILSALNEGKTYREIAKEIHVEYTVVRRTISKLLELNNCKNSRQLLKMARETGFLTPENKDNGS